MDPDNASRLVQALAEFGMASLGLTANDFLEHDTIIQLGYEPNRIDVLTGLSGVDFSSAYPRRAMVEFDGVEVAVIGRDDLIANKRALGRARDLADIEDIQARQEL